MDQPHFDLQSYKTRFSAMGRADADDLHSLAVAVNWPHRPQDMDILTRLGQGLIARDEIGRPLGCGMAFAYGADAAMIGMMMTHPKLQSEGLGREILHRVSDLLGARRLRLNATRSAWRLYQTSGFHEAGSVIQYQGVLDQQVPLAAPNDAVTPAATTDLPAMVALDAAKFGANRAPIIKALFQQSRAVTLWDGADLNGFAMCRPFGRGHVIGPLHAPSEDAAIAMVRALANDHSGGFLRLDCDPRFDRLGAYLKSIGLEHYDQVVAMTRNGHFGPTAQGPQVYAVASQALG